jgi:NAD(P)-dependent dehydrogenase (short-subunit alcohol dehydrogenase family)
MPSSGVTNSGPPGDTGSLDITVGQVAVATGGASGIRLAPAEAPAARGVRVVPADVREETLFAAATALISTGATVLPVVADVSDGAQMNTVAERTIARFGRVDLVFNNAGVAGPVAPMWEREPTTWSWLLDIEPWESCTRPDLRTPAHRPAFRPHRQHPVIGRVGRTSRPHAVQRHDARRRRSDRVT